LGVGESNLLLYLPVVIEQIVKSTRVASYSYSSTRVGNKQATVVRELLYGTVVAGGRGLIPSSLRFLHLRLLVPASCRRFSFVVSARGMQLEKRSWMSWLCQSAANQNQHIHQKPIFSKINAWFVGYARLLL
jgi:hypothetical protein